MGLGFRVGGLEFLLCLWERACLVPCSSPMSIYAPDFPKENVKELKHCRKQRLVTPHIYIRNIVRGLSSKTIFSSSKSVT